MAIPTVLFSNQFDHYFTRSSKDGPNSKNFTVKTGPILLEIARIFSKLSKLLSPHTFTSILTKFEPKKQIFCNFHNKLTKKFELGLILPKIFQNCFLKNHSPSVRTFSAVCPKVDLKVLKLLNVICKIHWIYVLIIEHTLKYL